MTQRHALIALPFLLIAACGPVEKKADEAGTAPPPAESGKSGSVAGMVKPYVEGPLTVGVDGVGPITGATAFDLPTFKVLFPRAVVAQAFLHLGTGRPQPIINVELNQTPLMEVSKGEDGDLGSIRLEGGDVRGPKPGFFDFVGTAKYEAWSKLAGTQRDAAMQQYIALVDTLAG